MAAPTISTAWYIDILQFRCYDKENFERKELSNMLIMNMDMNKGNRSLAPECAQSA